MKLPRLALMWALAATLGLSGLVQLLPGPSVVSAVAIEPRAAGLGLSSVAKQTAGELSPTPETFHVQSFGPAESDPFQMVVPAVAAAPARAPVVDPPAVVLSAALPQPTVPPSRHRFLGQLVEPDGSRRVFLEGNGKEILAAVGTVLDDGYTVVAIEPTAIRLSHVPTQTHLVLNTSSGGGGP